LSELDGGAETGQYKRRGGREGHKNQNCVKAVAFGGVDVTRGNRKDTAGFNVGERKGESVKGRRETGVPAYLVTSWGN